MSAITGAEADPKRGTAGLKNHEGFLEFDPNEIDNIYGETTVSAEDLAGLFSAFLLAAASGSVHSVTEPTVLYEGGGTMSRQEATVFTSKRLRAMTPGRRVVNIVAAVFFLGLCGQVTAQEADGGQSEGTKASSAHAGMSADQVAKELSNPAGSLSSIVTFLQYTTYKGDLPDADDQDAWSLDMQPVLPFKVGDKGRSVIFRPFIPIILQAPIFDATTGSWDDSDVELGDISAQLVYSGNEMKDAHNGYLWGIGGNVITPSATEDALGGDRWNLGPTLFGGVVREWGLIGLVVQHSWRVGGSNHEDYSVTSGQYFIAISLGNGWQFTTTPNFAYDHEAEGGDDFTFPIGAGLSKTTRFGKMPIKFAGEIQYYLEQADTFGPEWLFKFTVTPVINNPFEHFFH